MIPKFRAWHRKEKRMFFVAGIKWCGPYIDKLCFLVPESKDSPNLKEKWVDFVHHPENIVLMRSTGLEDKDGKEIFEGDIVKFIDDTYKKKEMWDRKGHIIWSDEFAEFGIRDNKSKRGHLGFGFIGLKNIEVIGNVHESPELLGEEK